MTITQLPLEEFISNVRPAYSGKTWQEVLSYMESQPYETEVVNQLRQVLRTDGKFREPIVVIDGEVMNGMHRSVASILENVHTINVSDEHVNLTDQDIHIEVEFTFSIPFLQNPSTTEIDHHDHLVMLLRSFPLSNNYWTQADTMSSSHGIMIGLWNCPPEYKEEFLSQLVHRAEREGITLTIIKSRLMTPDEWLEGDE